METIELTQEQFDATEPYRSGMICKEGSVIKKIAGDDWVLMTYGKQDKETGSFDIDFKIIIIK